ncbi:SusC/RagA family TonB-linked outer membrane protein [Pedobacter nyackensis]|uniref:SusC/RagA family TonB-linked outer membrane protein n=1 Tax=Pedobacter nyackensis TaxID=475255 RepID=UPI0029304592|nr:SusC/RagA family TonB-linked outer membrane protein [Pedobacter nyackensis]
MYKIYTKNLGWRNRHAPTILLTMKLTAIILLTTIMHVTASTFAQKLSYRQKNASLEEIFKEIKKQTGYTVFWSSNSLTNRRLDVAFKYSSLPNVMEKCLDGQDLTYTIENNTIVIREREMTMVDKLISYFDVIEIKGRITDERGKPLPGATVMVKKGGRATITDAGGEYLLAGVDSKAVLIVSYLGYKSKDVAINGRTVVNVSLTEDTEDLNDVVVVGYGTTKRKDLVGSVATISAEDMRKQPATNFTQALVGRAAGVQVSRPNGAPGGGAAIRIRGMSTVLGVNDPLFVIDGIPVQLYNGGGTDALRSAPANGLLDPLAGIDMNDIENIEVLKDATATAIYGSRAANGVIIITTKKGRAGEKPVFSLNYDVALDKQTKFYDVLSGPEYVKFMQETYAAAGETIDDVTFPGNADTDWQRAVIETGVTQNLNLSLLGASKDGATNYGFSSGLTDQNGILINTGFKRYSLRANVESKIFNAFKIGTNLNYSFIKQIGTSSSLYANYLAPTYRPDLPIFNPDGTYANDGGNDNPVASRKGTDLGQSNRFLASVYAELEIADGFKLRSSIAYDINNNTGFTYSPSWMLSEYFYDQKGSRNDKSFQYNNRIFDNTLSYIKVFKRHHIDAVAGASWTLNKSNYLNVSSINFPNDDVLNNLGSAGQISSYASDGESSGLESFFMRANYNYDGKYYLTLSGRADNSTKFGPGNQWGYFPSVGVAWRFSKEKFMEGLSFVDDAKIRLTTGKTGTSAFGGFGFLTLFNTGYFYNGVNGLRANPGDGQPNPDIRWESTQQTDAALELSFFKSRLTTSITYYRKYTEGLITGPKIPVSGGYTFQTKNLGDISNQGWEFTVSAVPLRTGEFTWTSDFNITFNKNKVEKTYGTALYGSILLTEGEPLNGILGYRTKGLYQSQAEVDQLNAAARIKTGNPNAFYHNALTGPGDVQYVDLNGDGVITIADRTTLGYAQNPKYYGGWSNRLRFKNLELSSLFQFDVGSELQREVSPDKFYGYGQNVSPLVLTAWTPENPNTSQPRNAINGPSQNVDDNSDRFVDDASFLRLKNVQLSYMFKNNMLTKLHISQLRVFAGMSNLFTWTKYKGLDPEVNSEGSFTDNGRDTGVYPQSRTVTFGINLKF